MARSSPPPATHTEDKFTLRESWLAARTIETTAGLHRTRRAPAGAREPVALTTVGPPTGSPTSGCTREPWCRPRTRSRLAGRRYDDSGERLATPPASCNSPMVQRHIGIARVRPEPRRWHGRACRRAVGEPPLVNVPAERGSPMPFHAPSGRSPDMSEDSTTRSRHRRRLQRPVNAAYLAICGMRTLVLEQRRSSAAPPSPRSCTWLRSPRSPTVCRCCATRSSTSFELVKHGFTPLYMPTTFVPT